MKHLLALSLILSGVPAAAASAIASLEAPAASPAARRADELARALGEKDQAALRKLIAASFTPPAAENAWMLASARYRQGRAGEPRVTATAANQATLVYRAEHSRRLGSYLVEVEPNAPYRIARVTPQRAPDEPFHVPPTEAERLKAIDDYIGRIAAADIFSGVVLIAREGRPVYHRAFGLADRTFDVRNRLDTKFNLGSINKMFTGIAIGQLIDAGKISLEDPLSKYLPDFPDAESAKKIRIKHLLTHTSGLNSYFNDEFMRSSPGRFRDIPSYMEVARKNAKLEFEPGTNWEYSNTGMLVLGRVVEIASGMDYYDYIQTRIYDPAGMKDTGSFETDAVVKNRATGYEMDFSGARNELRSGILRTPARGAPAGGGYSTAPDLLKLANALQAGKLLKPETFRLFSTAKPELGSPEAGYGFLIAFRGPAGRDVTGHVGDFGDGTCADLAMIRDSEPRYTAIVLANGTANGACNYMSNLINRMFPAKTG